jgi:hypothetical protein
MRHSKNNLGRKYVKKYELMGQTSICVSMWLAVCRSQRETEMPAVLRPEPETIWRRKVKTGFPRRNLEE